MNMGRRPQIKDAVPVHINLPLAHKQAIEELAAEEDVSISSVYRRAVAEFVERILQPEQEPEEEQAPRVRKGTREERRGWKFLRFLSRHVGSRPKDNIWITKAQLLAGTSVSTWDKALAAAQFGAHALTEHGHETMIDIKKEGNTVTGVYVRIMSDALSNDDITEVADAVEGR